MSTQAEPIQKRGRRKLLAGPWTQCNSSWREQERSSPGSVWFLCLTELLKVKLGGNFPSVAVCLVRGRVSSVPTVQSPKETILAAQVILRQVCHTERKELSSPFLQNPVSGLQLTACTPLALPYLGWLHNQTRKTSSCRFTLGVLKLKAQKLEDKISAAGTSITTAQFLVLYILEGILF